MKTIVFTIACVLTNTLPRWLMHSDGLTLAEQIEQGNTFCNWQAFSFGLLFAAAIFKTPARRETLWLIWGGALAANNWIDEARGHAAHMDIIEVLFALSVTVWLIYSLNYQALKRLFKWRSQ